MYILHICAYTETSVHPPFISCPFHSWNIKYVCFALFLLCDLNAGSDAYVMLLVLLAGHFICNGQVLPRLRTFSLPFVTSISFRLNILLYFPRPTCSSTSNPDLLEYPKLIDTTNCQIFSPKPSHQTQSSPLGDSYSELAISVALPLSRGIFDFPISGISTPMSLPCGYLLLSYLIGSGMAL